MSLRNISALLYVKLEFLEDGVGRIKASKTRRVPPNISIHFLPDKDNSTLSVQLPTNKEGLTCRFSLCTKPTFGEYPELPTAVCFQLLSWSSELLTMETGPINLTYLSQFYQFWISPSISFTLLKQKLNSCSSVTIVTAYSLKIPIAHILKIPTLLFFFRQEDSFGRGGGWTWD